VRRIAADLDVMPPAKPAAWSLIWSRTEIEKGEYMHIRKIVFAVGCIILAFSCSEQPSRGTQVGGAREVTRGIGSVVPETGELPATDVNALCNDSACFQACTSSGACDGFCIANQCTCVGTSGPPCS
jgi:hypothetical protein